jgi:hypothetical protein
MSRVSSAILILLFASSLGWPQSDPVQVTQAAQAVALLQQAVTALDGNTTVTDVTLQATALYTVGSDEESGVATLEAKVGSGTVVGNQSKIILNLSGGQREEVRSGTAGIWVGPDGEQHSMALHNCWTDAAWFFPGLSLQAALSSPMIVLSYIGQETQAGLTVQHLALSRLIAGQEPATTALIQHLSSMDIYLDAASYLPAVMTFNIHPDTDAGLDLPLEIRFSNYQAKNGIKAPLHIQKLVQGSLVLDLNATSAAVNSGTPDSEFTFQLTGGAQ